MYLNGNTNEIRNAFEHTEYCSAIFFDEAQALDKVSYNGLLYKNKTIKVRPQANDVTYLGIHLNRRLTWRKHRSSKITSMIIRAANLNWL